MLNHNLLLFFRNIKKHKNSFLINTIGLASGLTCVLLIALWVNDELNVDKFHENDADLYHMMETSEYPGYIEVGETTSGHAGELLKEHMPEIELAVQVGRYPNDATLSTEDQVIRADGRYVSKDYFKIFSFPLLEGNKNKVWEEKNGIMISEKLARILFGSASNAMGKAVDFQHRRTLTVSGVFEDIPNRSSQQFDFVLSFEELAAANSYLREWGSVSTVVYFKMRPGTDISAFNKKIENFIIEQTDYRQGHRKPFLKKYSEEYLYGKYENGIQTGGRITYVKLFSIISVFILIIACINFMNLSTARASRRLKEIGVKKAAGAHRRSLIVQHLTESLAVSFIALFVSLLLVHLLLPEFNRITGKELMLSYNSSTLLWLLGITVITGLLSGSYPALYLSGFSPVDILKGKLQTFGSEVWIRRSLVITQYTISIVLIVSVLVVYKQIEFIQSKSLGYTKDQIIHFDREGKTLDFASMETFLTELEKIPGVVSASSSRTKLADEPWGVGGIEWPGKELRDATEFQHMIVYYDLLEMLDIELLEGRTFSKEFTSENTKTIFNEAAIAYMGLEDPVGKVVNFRGIPREIIGVVKDFHFSSFHENISPMIINMWPERLTKLMVKLEAGKEEETLKAITDFYQTYNPGFLFSYTFLDENYQSLYKAEKRIAVLSRYFAGLAIIISCLGLFALAAFTAERRKKEIGIRKALGQGSTQLSILLSGEFAKLVIVAVFIGLPLAYFLTSDWLSGFAYKIEIKLWYFIVAGVTALLVALLTVGTQTVRAATRNPVESLREE
ncbi:FtsX-like permease family protein [Leptobacterium flavescens]|uniref:FtsX-like permease family protein n=1 Tax=Leptobacterium flavescens TaxID=472055 RepID=A0A6P0UI63_9FLAO|nr:ABC transporter permease [Leptobacterium flavescens]NER13031.1 FtsX-like permease family protein [Leptobacterium flavescens]